MKPFELSRDITDPYRDAPAPLGPLGAVVVARTYAWPVDGGGVESWYDICRRVVEGCYRWQQSACILSGARWDDGKAQRSAASMFSRLFTLKWCPPGRGLYTMGTHVLHKTGVAANNCAFRTTEDIDSNPSAPFTWIMDHLMLGVGVGSDTRGAEKWTPTVPTIGAPFRVEDTREGWAAALGALFDAYAGKRPLPSAWDVSGVRPKGAPINGFGGVASGPDPLVRMLTEIEQILRDAATLGRYGLGIDRRDIVSLVNWIGVCVVSGGVRRSSEIMLDEGLNPEFADLKINDPEGRQSHLWASNNSCVPRYGQPFDYDDLASRVVEQGEMPGLFWLDNARRFGRMRPEEATWADALAMGTNPCAEQTLENGEVCCLVETFPSRHESLHDYLETLKVAYLYAKTVTCVPVHDPLAASVIARNRRIGCSMSGIQDAFTRHGRERVLGWMERGYLEVQRLDRVYSGWLGVPRSRKTTSVKPSGSVSLLPGVSAGIHHELSRYVIRRIRIQDTSPLIEALTRAGVPLEVDVYSANTMCASFPVHYPSAPDLIAGEAPPSLLHQFADLEAVQRAWADNQVSATLMIEPHEARLLPDLMRRGATTLKSMSVLRRSGHGFAQPPIEPISRAEYERLSAGIGAIDMTRAQHEAEDRYCDGASCEIRS